ncbi:uncharacterized protein [Oscarella lobularis]|uniref:uncharacterized protein n=1 Tax=Oscarella lobularis TaxID=121494 RepID=UPI003313DA80
MGDERMLDIWKSLRTPRLTASTESALPNDIIIQARLRKARELHSLRHKDYATEFYGTMSEKEQKRKKIRETLKTQVQEQDDRRLRELRLRSKSNNEDEKEEIHDEKEETQRKESSHKFRDGNKTMIEWRAEQRIAQRKKNQEVERELLKKSPINWNKTLS